ncbi:DNA ligase 1-like [Clytia hemisphaerica]|uniref:Cnidarian restricted protein n=1 Tax=Clytia hemisphaerica TaxID=252671 RepID=A0A7M5WTI9_9CNID
MEISRKIFFLALIVTALVHCHETKKDELKKEIEREVRKQLQDVKQEQDGLSAKDVSEKKHKQKDDDDDEEVLEDDDDEIDEFEDEDEDLVIQHAQRKASSEMKKDPLFLGSVIRRRRDGCSNFFRIPLSSFRRRILAPYPSNCFRCCSAGTKLCRRRDDSSRRRRSCTDGISNGKK